MAHDEICHPRAFTPKRRENVLLRLRVDCGERVVED